MADKSKTDQYVEHINSRILPFIDYYELQASYDTDMAYAKGILNRLHEAVAEVYGGGSLDETDGDEGFVIVPGVVCGRDSGKICIALLDLDLSSSGEHWGTSFLCKYGVIAQDGVERVSNNDAVLKSEIREIVSIYLPYDYCYTASIPGDIHVNRAKLPEKIKAVLADFRNHRAVLQFEQDEDNEVNPYDLGYGFLGNGITVWNRAEEKDGDYPTVAHISTEREVTVYDKDMPESVVDRIKAVAQSPDTWAFGFKSLPGMSDTASAPADLYARGTDMMESFDFLIKIDALLPGADSHNLQKIIEFAESLDEEGSYTKGEYLSAVVTEYDLVTYRYGQDIARKLLDLSATFIVNPSKIQDAAMLLHDGAKPKDIPRLVISGKSGPPIGGAKTDGNTEKPSVLEQIRAAAKAPKEPKKDKPNKDRSEPEL